MNNQIPFYIVDEHWRLSYKLSIFQLIWKSSITSNTLNTLDYVQNVLGLEDSGYYSRSSLKVYLYE